MTTTRITRRANRDAPRNSREARTVPSHDSALFHGAAIEITRQGAQLAVAREALRLIALDEQMGVGARGIARGALDRMDGLR